MKPIGQILAKSAYSTGEWEALGKRFRRERNNSCHICRRRDCVTHIHHLDYVPGKAMHEYEDEDLVLLCESCHQEMHIHLRNFRRFIFGKMNPQAFKVLNGGLLVGLEFHRDPVKWAYAVAGLAALPNLAEYCYKHMIESPKDTAAIHEQKAGG